LINRRILSHPAPVFIGLISYPLYLWHWPLLVFARILAAGPPSPGIRGAIVALSLLLAFLTYEAVERPVRGKGGPGAVRGLACAAAALAGLALVVIQHQGMPGRLPDAAAMQGLVEEFNAAHNKFPECSTALAGPEKLTWCRTSGAGAPRYAIFGDSHADHLFPGIAAADAGNWLLIGETSCPPALGVRGYLDGSEEECSRKNAAAAEVLERQESVSTVVLSFLGPYYLSDQGFAADHVGRLSPAHYHLEPLHGIGGSKREVLEQGLRRTVVALQAVGKQVVFYLDIPEMPSTPSQCITRLSFLGQPARCAIGREVVARRQAEYRDMISSIARDYPSVRVFDPLNYICGPKECELAPGGRPNYRDSHHLSAGGSGRLAVPFLQWLRTGAYPPAPAGGS